MNIISRDGNKSTYLPTELRSPTGLHLLIEIVVLNCITPPSYMNILVILWILLRFVLKLNTIYVCYIIYCCRLSLRGCIQYNYSNMCTITYHTRSCKQSSYLQTLLTSVRKRKQTQLRSSSSYVLVIPNGNTNIGPSRT